MPYTPPAGNAVDFNFSGTYAAPSGAHVIFNFGGVTPPAGNINVFRALQAAIEEEAAWRDPRARQFYLAPAAPVVLPYVRGYAARALLFDDDLTQWVDPRARMRLTYVAPTAAAVRPVLFVVI